MPKQCPKCDFWSEDNAPQACPECGAALRLTMFSRQSDQPAEAEGSAPAWKTISDDRFRTMEQPIGVRMAQIGSGITFYFCVSHWGGRMIELLLLGTIGEADLDRVAVVVLFTSIALHVLAAVIGGIIASAWAVNWVPQGVGVGIGVFAVPLALLLVIHPQSLPVFLLLMGLTTVFSVLGAFFGHLLIRPMRYPVG